jgi:predicted extracellular nuclease
MTTMFYANTISSRQEKTSLQASPLRFASWNLENYHRSNKNKTRSIASVISGDLDLPHILAVQEVAGDQPGSGDERIGAEQNAASVTESITQQSTGKNAYAYQDCPPKNNEDGGKRDANIRCGFFYRTDRVELLEIHSIGEDSPAFRGSRKPLIGIFRDKKTGEIYTACNVHLCSNGIIPPDTPWSSQRDPERLAQRKTQVKLIADHMAQVTLPANLQNENTIHHQIILGDFNEPTHVSIGDIVQEAPEIPDVLAPLHARGFIRASEPPADDVRYTCWNDTTKMTIDHIYVSPSLAARISPPASTYSQLEYRPRKRVSDHSPVQININAPKQQQQPDVPQLTR